MKPEPEQDDERELREMFWIIFETLSEDKKRFLRNWWAKRKNPDIPAIFTRRDQYATHHEYGAANGLMIFLEIDRLKTGNESLIEVVYHEIFHCLLIAQGRHFISDFKKPDRVNKMEKDVKKFTLKALRSLFSDPDLCDNVQQEMASRKSLAGCRFYLASQKEEFQKDK